jgi:DNA uptake protein ComE-like DNA-binding protein
MVVFSLSSRVQYDFLRKVTEYVNYASSVSSEPSVKEVLADLVVLVAGRQKLIRIADQSGWRCAEIYDGEELASDEEDEKRLRRAKKEALAEIGKVVVLHECMHYMYLQFHIL